MPQLVRFQITHDIPYSCDFQRNPGYGTPGWKPGAITSGRSLSLHIKATQLSSHLVQDPLAFLGRHGLAEHGPLCVYACGGGGAGGLKIADDPCRWHSLIDHHSLQRKTTSSASCFTGCWCLQYHLALSLCLGICSTRLRLPCVLMICWLDLQPSPTSVPKRSMDATSVRSCLICSCSSGHFFTTFSLQQVSHCNTGRMEQFWAFRCYTKANLGVEDVPPTKHHVVVWKRSGVHTHPTHSPNRKIDGMPVS